MKLFDKNDEGRVDYYEFISALHPREQYVPTNDAEKIEDEVIREVARCRCCDRFAVHQISDNKYRVSFFIFITLYCTIVLTILYLVWRFPATSFGENFEKLRHGSSRWRMVFS